MEYPNLAQSRGDNRIRHLQCHKWDGGCVQGKLLGEPVTTADWELETVSEKMTFLLAWRRWAGVCLPGIEKSRRHGGRHHRQSMFLGKRAARGTQRWSILVGPRVGCVRKGNDRREASWDKCRIFYVLTSGRGLKILTLPVGGQSGRPAVFSPLPREWTDLEASLHFLPSFAVTSFSTSDHQAPSRYMLSSSLTFLMFQSFWECCVITDTCLLLTHFLWVPKPRRERWAWWKAFLTGA